MRRIIIALMGTVSGLVLLFSYHTSLGQGAGQGGAVTAGAGTSGGTGVLGGTGDVATTAGATSGTVTGDVVGTRWGPVQVQISIANGKITAADAIVVPSGNGRDVEINNYAVPILNSEAVAAQSAQIDAVSGATVTSDGYVQSLQSAIDRAHRG